jgi:hypothetical protein
MKTYVPNIKTMRATKLETKKMDLPIVCDLSVFTPEERKRHEEESMELFKKAKFVIELNNGFAFHHDYSEEKFLTLANWTKDENKCCPFFTFELVIEPFASGREIIVRLKGSDQIKQGLKSGLDKLGIEVRNIID